MFVVIYFLEKFYFREINIQPERYKRDISPISLRKATVMIRYYRKFYFIKVYESWFTLNWKPIYFFTFNVFWHVKKKNQQFIPAVKLMGHTVELDLREDYESIAHRFNKRVRQQVRQAENEGNMIVLENRLDAFVNFYNDFARKRNTYLVNRQQLENIGSNLKIAFAISNGDILAAHTYLIDKESGIVRLHHSATRRLDEDVDKNRAGRANKHLTVHCIKHFKQEGFEIFDFGGYAKDTRDPGMKGINDFKLQFGGQVVPSIGYITWGYYLVKKITRLLGISGKL